MKDMNGKETKINDIGISLLRVLMCFGVILAHCWKHKGYDSLLFLPFKEIQTLAAPVFMLLSFYFLAERFLSPDESFLKKRMLRLLIPQIGWALIYWLVYLLLEPVPLNELFWQILTGHSAVLNATMWFQFDLIVLTLLFFLLFSFRNEKFSTILLICISFLCLILQHSGINYRLFSDLRFELSYPLGRLVEMLPYATIGFLLKHCRMTDTLKKYRYPVLIASLLLFTLPYLMSFPSAKGFGYAGITLLYLVILSFFITELLPFEMLPETIKKGMLPLCCHTLGIYCCHRLIHALVSRFLGYSPSSFLYCILLYILCYLFCSLLSLIPSKTIKKLVD